MKTYYDLREKSYHDILRIVPNEPCDKMYDFMTRTTQKMLPKNISFFIQQGKQKADLIFQYPDTCCKFFSQNLIDVLSKFMDMSDKCYPINIEGIDEKYYVIYNLKGYVLFNRNEHFFNQDTRFIKREPALFLNEEESTPPLFTFSNSLSLIVCEEIKQEIEKQKLTNIDFERTFSYSKPEYEAWKKFWGK